MADNRPGGEPTEAPTPRRLRDARNRGQVARSAELTAALGFAGAAAILLWVGDALFARLHAAVATGVALAGSSPDPAGAVPGALNGALDTVLGVSLPVAGAGAAVAVVAGFLQTFGKNLLCLVAFAGLAQQVGS